MAPSLTPSGSHGGECSLIPGWVVGQAPVNREIQYVHRQIDAGPPVHARSYILILSILNNDIYDVISLGGGLRPAPTGLSVSVKPDTE
jgi:hypothetical protein